MPSEVSIIIPSYNSQNTIAETIRRLKSQTAYEAILEIIIVDSSDDGVTKGLLSKIREPKLIIISPGIRVMPAKQRNIGACKATGDLLVFLDSDAYPRSNWLEEIINVYRKGAKAGGGSYLLNDSQINNTTAIAQYYLQLNEFLPAGKPRTKRVIPSCNFFCRKDLFIESKGFPEIRASEDSYFSCNINKIAQLIFIPSAIVYHIFREERKDFLKNQFLLGKYVYIYRRIHYNSIYLKGNMPILVFPLFILTKFFRVFFRIPFTSWYHICQFAKALPAFFIGLTAWYKGFLSASREYRKQKHFESTFSEYL